jgi:hypothetical protein
VRWRYLIANASGLATGAAVTWLAVSSQITWPTILVSALVLVVGAAIVIGIVDAAQASQWRTVARERRERWESRQRQYHGYDTGRYDIDDEDDEDDDPPAPRPN